MLFYILIHLLKNFEMKVSSSLGPPIFTTLFTTVLIDRFHTVSVIELTTNTLPSAQGWEVRRSLTVFRVFSSKLEGSLLCRGGRMDVSTRAASRACG